MMFVFIRGPNDIIYPIDPTDISYIDAAADKNGKIIIGECMIMTKSRYGVRAKGSPKDIGIDIMKQIVNRKYLDEDKL